MHTKSLMHIKAKRILALRRKTKKNPLLQCLGRTMQDPSYYIFTYLNVTRSIYVLLLFFYVVDILLVEDRLGWKPVPLHSCFSAFAREACPRYIEKMPWWEASQMVEVTMPHSTCAFLSGRLSLCRATEVVRSWQTLCVQIIL